MYGTFQILKDLKTDIIIIKQMSQVIEVRLGILQNEIMIFMHFLCVVKV